MRDFLVVSLVGSLVLTVLLNVVPRVFPGATQRAEAELHRRFTEADPGADATGRRVRVFFPWKAMLAISIGLTVLLNVIGALVG